MTILKKLGFFFFKKKKQILCKFIEFKEMKVKQTKKFIKDLKINNREKFIK